MDVALVFAPLGDTINLGATSISLPIVEGEKIVIEKMVEGVWEFLLLNIPYNVVLEGLRLAQQERDQRRSEWKADLAKPL